VAGLSGARVRANADRVRAEIAAAARRAGRDPDDVQLLAAVKYVAAEDLGALAEAGIELLGENRAQELEAKRAAYGDTFRWHFIGRLQSRKVKQVLPLVELIHSVASDSALRQLERHGTPDTRVLVEVDVAGEEGKAGIAPAELPAFLDRCPVTVAGLMTMPPFTEDPQASRPHFAALRELAAAHGLPHLSMGTSQDYAVAVEEGATIVRIGSVLFT
jgi:pyridoxal phosphate enzyme (YggS family)